MDGDEHDLERALREFERAFIVERLSLCDGEVKRAARLMSVPLRTLYRKLDEHAIRLRPDKTGEQRWSATAR